MTEKEFLNAVSSGSEDVLHAFLDTLSSMEVDYCVIGGLAVNAYVEPVASLDLGVVVAGEDIDKVCKAVADQFTIERFPHSVNLTTQKSSLRIQIQTDPRYRDFIARAGMRTVLGYAMKVAAIEDVLQGKVWVYSDEERRKSKRQKHLADIARLIEAYPSLADRVPDEIRQRIE